MKPRLLIVGRTRYRLPLAPSLERKFDALRDVFDVRVLGSGADGSAARDETFRLVKPFRPRILDGLAFHLGLPLRVARELRRFQPDAVVTQGAHEGAAALLGRALARSDARVVLDVHGDWRTATRLYGSPARRLLSPVADTIAGYAVRHADAVRTVSDFTTGVVRDAGVEPTAVFPAFMDLEPFLERPPAPLPDRPTALFVGVLERYKNVDGLVEAWRRVAGRVPQAELRIVGKGSLTGLVDGLVQELPKQATWIRELSTSEVALELDRATCLVLPSRREGMGRVIVEAFCRGRPVIGTRAGGIPDLVRNDENGLLVEPGSSDALVEALVSMLSEHELAERLAAGARASAEYWIATPETYASRLREVVDRALETSARNAQPARQHRRLD